MEPEGSYDLLFQNTTSLSILLSCPSAVIFPSFTHCQI